jgi:hypothetical protein
MMKGYWAALKARMGMRPSSRALTIKERCQGFWWGAVVRDTQGNLLLHGCLDVLIPFKGRDVTANLLWKGFSFQEAKGGFSKKSPCLKGTNAELVMTYGSEESAYEVEEMEVTLSAAGDVAVAGKMTLSFPEEIPLGHDYNRRFLRLGFSFSCPFKGICVAEKEIAALASEFRDPQWVQQKMSLLFDVTRYEGPFYPDPLPGAYTEPTEAWFYPKLS